MSESEVATILVLFHLAGYRCLKHFYLQYICKHISKDFSKPLSYNYFVELQAKVSLMQVCFFRYADWGNCTGVSFVDSIKFCVGNVDDRVGGMTDLRVRLCARGRHYAL